MSIMFTSPFLSMSAVAFQFGDGGAIFGEHFIKEKGIGMVIFLCLVCLLGDIVFLFDGHMLWRNRSPVLCLLLL